MPRTPAALVVALALLSACQGPAAPPPPLAVDNAALGLRFTGLPAGVQVTANEGERLTFSATLDGVAGEIAVHRASPAEGGVNLVAEARRYGAAAADAEGGKFFGANELVTPWGPAYKVRALVDRGSVEEQQILLLHPGDPQQLLALVLRYPPGTPEVARDRLAQFLDLLAALEPLPEPSGG